MKLQNFFELNKKDLIHIFTKERTEHGDGVLYIDLTDKEKGNVVFLPLTSEYLTDEVKNTINERKPQVSDETIFIFGVELDDQNNNIVNRIEYDIKS